MNKLQLCAARPRTASTFHRHIASNGAVGRLRHAVSVMPHGNGAAAHGSASLRAQWFRNTATGALECRWMTDTFAEPPMRPGIVDIHPALRMFRRIGRAGMRPPSRQTH